MYVFSTALSELPAFVPFLPVHGGDFGSHPRITVEPIKAAFNAVTEIVEKRKGRIATWSPPV